MVVIRLARAGAKKRPFFHVVVADARCPLGGRVIDRVGHYNPVAKGKEKSLVLELERINYWLGNGAQPSQRVKSLLKELSNAAA
jgi:small subunit ribosomal protein S16